MKLPAFTLQERGELNMPPTRHCSWKRSQQNTQEVLGPRTALAELSSSNTVPGETESQSRFLVHSAGLMLQPRNTVGSGGAQGFSYATPPTAPAAATWERQHHLLLHLCEGNCSSKSQQVTAPELPRGVDSHRPMSWDTRGDQR